MISTHLRWGVFLVATNFQKKAQKYGSIKKIAVFLCPYEIG